LGNSMPRPSKGAGDRMAREYKRTTDLSTGDLRHKIFIQGKTPIPDGEGGFIEDWGDLRQAWAKVEAIQARQRYQFQSVNVEATHRITVRGEVVISEDNRIRFKNRAFEVKTVEDIDERGIKKVITCREMR